MADPRFFAVSPPQRLTDIAAAAGAVHAGDAERRFSGCASLQTAGPEDISFLDGRRYLPLLKETKAGAVVVQAAFADQVPAGTVALIAASPALGFARIAALFHPPAMPQPGIHPSAAVASDAVIGEGTEIGPCVAVGAGARIGAGCILAPNVTVGPGVEIGDGCRLHANSSVSHAILGRGVVLHPGARIGQEGFGLTATPDGQFVTMPQLGRVLLGDFVEVGANSCVDRGSQGDTVLGPGTRLDNQVQIGHNVQTGRGCVIVAQVGISGSTVLGDFVTIAAQAGLAGHLHLGSQSRVGAQAGVMNDVPAKTDVIGSPAMPAREFWRIVAGWKKLVARDKADGKAG